jgi:hypothetical protein
MYTKEASSLFSVRNCLYVMGMEICLPSKGKKRTLTILDRWERSWQGAALRNDYSPLQKDGMWSGGLKPAGWLAWSTGTFYERDYGLLISVIIMFLVQQLPAFRKRYCSMHSDGISQFLQLNSDVCKNVNKCWDAVNCGNEKRSEQETSRLIPTGSGPLHSRSSF